MQSTSALLARAAKQFRMWMPNMPMTLVDAKNATANRPAMATFRVLPRMTKHEVKEYLTKIYDLPVKRVNTVNYLGKRKQVRVGSKPLYYKYKDYKKAIVTFDESLMDVGLGMRIPELDDEEED